MSARKRSRYLGTAESQGESQEISCLTSRLQEIPDRPSNDRPHFSEDVGTVLRQGTTKSHRAEVEEEEATQK